MKVRILQSANFHYQILESWTPPCCLQSGDAFEGPSTHCYEILESLNPPSCCLRCGNLLQIKMRILPSTNSRYEILESWTPPCCWRSGDFFEGKEILESLTHCSEIRESWTRPRCCLKCGNLPQMKVRILQSSNFCYVIEVWTPPCCLRSEDFFEGKEILEPLTHCYEILESWTPACCLWSCDFASYVASYVAFFDPSFSFWSPRTKEPINLYLFYHFHSFFIRRDEHRRFTFPLFAPDYLDVFFSFGLVFYLVLGFFF